MAVKNRKLKMIDYVCVSVNGGFQEKRGSSKDKIVSFVACAKQRQEAEVKLQYGKTSTLSQGHAFIFCRGF